MCYELIIININIALKFDTPQMHKWCSTFEPTSNVAFQIVSYYNTLSTALTRQKESSCWNMTKWTKLAAPEQLHRLYKIVRKKHWSKNTGTTNTALTLRSTVSEWSKFEMVDLVHRWATNMILKELCSPYVIYVQSTAIVLFTQYLELENKVNYPPFC